MFSQIEHAGSTNPASACLTPKLMTQVSWPSDSGMSLSHPRTQLRDMQLVSVRDFRLAQVMIFAVEEINRNENLLPNVSLGYRIYDSCSSRLSSMSAIMAVMNNQEFAAEQKCNGQSPIHAIIGETESATTIILSRTTGPFKIPVISHSSACECLSNRKNYPSFFRTISSDYYQGRALALLVKHLGWTWVGAVNSDNDYGNNGMDIFLNAAKKEGICIEYSVKFYRTEPEKLIKVVNTMKRGTAKVIVAFVSFIEMGFLIDQLSIRNITGLQMIGVFGWIASQNLITPNTFHVMGGSLGFSLRKIYIDGFPDYAYKAFWDTAFPCSHRDGDYSQNEINCSTYEDILVLRNYNEEVAEHRYVSNVYKAVYAVAYALHSLLECKGQEGCEKTVTIQPHQVVEALKKVNFTVKFGERVWFDSTGAAIANYEVVNWQQDSDGSFQFKAVGYYDASLPPDQRFVLNTENIIWAGGQLQKPKSVCSESCPPGTRKAVQKGRPVCCYDCIPCADGEISNETDSNNCMQCPGEFWSNAEKNKCVLKAVEFLSFTEVMGIVLVFFSLFGIILECSLGSTVGFWAVLGYIGLLALLCFILAFLARTLPDNFNEAKFITFSMLIFCAVWITFIPSYVSSPGKFSVAVEIFAILASSFGLLFCIFAPKCYIILFKPEQNTKQHLMGKTQSKRITFLQNCQIDECFTVSCDNLTFQISHSSACECLSNRKDYPSFFRTISSDYHQGRALALLVKHLGWTWVGAVNSDTDYGNNGMAIFLNAAEKEGICVEYSVKFYRTDYEKLQKVVKTMKQSTAKVVVGFLAFFEMSLLVEQLSIQNVTGIQLIGVVGWTTSKNLITPSTFHVMGGSLGFALRKIHMEGFSDYINKYFWKTAFACSERDLSQDLYCSRNQDLIVLKNYTEDVSEQRFSSNVYKAVYAVAFALHSLLKCKEQGCAKALKIHPQQVVEALKKVNFTVKFGDHVWFDSTGAAIANYEVVNWQRHSSGSFQFKAVGYYDASLPPDQRFMINTEDIIWAGGQLEKPRSVCTESCPPGTRKAVQKGRPVCCYDCIPCADGEISNETDSNNCMQCPWEYWSNAEKNKCVLKAVEFLSFTEMMSIVLIFFSLFGVGTTAKIILECSLGSTVGFWAVLGYIGLLALMCFILAFLARTLPDNFNEAKFITFSMLIFCAVWITFIPAYVSSPGKFTPLYVTIIEIFLHSYILK
ncbi:putative extracellular calcium-sensing receptor [Triplophysa rosa]|uniref:Extracellular calcium-sensing receptor n=1 Tax=Triplophysa rosa TaxID=992332 RepID=A0A9W7TV73_TRIRA|nr:putative extracellular calcium-sensing receptor [Triplophysa rosa]